MPTFVGMTGGTVGIPLCDGNPATMPGKCLTGLRKFKAAARFFQAMGI
jgi:hypothetical protein